MTEVQSTEPGFEQLFPIYRVTEWRDGEVFRVRNIGQVWLPINTVVGSEVDAEIRVGTPLRLMVRRAGS